MPMLGGGFELIVGWRQDAEFGPCLVVGRGGVTTEIDPDVVLIPKATSVEAVARGLTQLRCWPILAGYRGSPALDCGSVAELGTRLYGLAVQHPDLEIELNPIFVRPDGISIADFRGSQAGTSS
ncbi:acetate--CoA ligase family protein [Mycolicibacterium goodii]|uniref:acetate--CoA ligase family protein n=1 Tax=Mycolicibacterium goodii TaxID=134601 RepID=UPI00256F109C|nr:acetate--CoA ligase family protein [Mycolicibacterium goodii]